MPLGLDIKKTLSNRSERVKAVDFHPTEPWLLAALYNGNVNIWNYETQTLVKAFEVTDLPVRAAKFVPRKNWIVTGSDDMYIRVFNYNTLEKVIAFEGHQDYIRSLAVHPTQSLVLSCSDDMLIKLWDWEKGWKNVMTFEGHAHYVMQIVFNPKDGNSFASASLDRTVKVWSLGTSSPNYTLEGHLKGVNCVDYYYGGDKPYIISGADDKTVKIWDYQNKTCVQTLEGHSQNVTVSCFHPELPIIITGSEDGTVRIWHSTTFRLESTLNYGMERVWAIGYMKGSNDVAFGYDEGTISIKLGREEPVISMDNSGKIIWAKHNEILSANIKTSVEENVKDGERLTLPAKELGNSEIFPQTLQHSPNGRFVVVCGDGEYVIYTALAWRNKSFGSALDFVWALDSNEYAIRESNNKVRLFKSFKEKTEINLMANFSIEGIFGGGLLGLRSDNFLMFYDWDTGICVRRVDVAARKVFWSESDLVTIVTDDSFYILKFHRTAYKQYLDRTSGRIPDGGIEEAFEFISEIHEIVKTGCWIGDSFIYTNSLNRANYIVGEQVSTISHFDKNLYLLGYLPKENRVYLTDKDMNVVSYSLPLTLIEYQTAVIRGDLETAEKLLPSVPEEHRNRIAKFLEGRGMKERALEISTDPEHRFELALGLNRLNVAFDIAAKLEDSEKWSAVGDAALKDWQFELAQECLKRGGDLEGLFMLYKASGNTRGVREVAHLAGESFALFIMVVTEGRHNLAFLSFLICGDLEECISLLVKANRIPEAALFARTYLPSAVPSLVQHWRNMPGMKDKSMGGMTMASPDEQEEAFPDYKYALIAEEAFKRRHAKGGIPAREYLEWKDSLDWDIIAELKHKFPKGIPTERPKTPKPVIREEEKIEDAMSHLSMEVNTTGTGSIPGDFEEDANGYEAAEF